MYSVVIPSIGRINYLIELLDSILMQTLLPEEIIIVLDNNKKCKDLLNHLNKESKIKLIFTDGLNTPQKRNIGVNVAKTDNIIFSDDDDLWEINKGKFTIESLKNSQVVCHAYSKFGSLNKKPKYYLGRKNKIVPLYYLLSGDNIFGGGSGIAGKKEIFMSVPFNDNLYSEDYDWWIKIFLADIKVAYIPNSLVRYRKHDSNMTLNFYKIYLHNSKILNKVFIKSIILFFTFLSGYLNITIKIFLNFKKILF